jgi:flagellar hook-length control protein FliK
MATTSLPTVSTPPTTVASNVNASGPSVATNIAPTANAISGSDFMQLLSELLGADGSPLAALDALQSLQTMPATDAKKTEDSDNANSAVDPSLLAFLAANLQPTLPGAQKIDTEILAIEAEAGGITASSNVDLVAATNTDKGGKAESNKMDLALLASLSSTEEAAKLTDTLVAKSPSDGRQDIAKANEVQHNGEQQANAMTVNQLAQNTANRVQEVPERTQVRAHVGTPQWSDELAGKLTVLIGRGVHSASLQLSPEQLGPLEIQISVQNDQTSVWFGAAHAETRTALEQALPRLRELLAGQGLNLSDAGVFREAPRERGKSYSPSGASSGDEREFSVAAIAARGIVDAYA